MVWFFLEGRDVGVQFVQQSLAWVPDDVMLTLSHLGDARSVSAVRPLPRNTDSS